MVIEIVSVKKLKRWFIECIAGLIEIKGGI
jgi:hypothetical protein